MCVYFKSSAYNDHTHAFRHHALCHPGCSSQAFSASVKASSNFLAWTENTLSDLVTTMWFAHLGIRERAIAIDNV